MQGEERQSAEELVRLYALLGAMQAKQKELRGDIKLHENRLTDAAKRERLDNGATMFSHDGMSVRYATGSRVQPFSEAYLLKCTRAYFTSRFGLKEDQATDYGTEFVDTLYDNRPRKEFSKIKVEEDSNRKRRRRVTD